MAKSESDARMTMADEILERVDVLARSLVQINDRQVQYERLLHQNIEQLQALNDMVVAQLSRVSTELGQMKEATQQAKADAHAQLERLTRGLDSLWGQVALLQARSENIEFRLLSLKDAPTLKE